MLTCNFCGAIVTSRACPSCGSTSFSERAGNANFCRHCGIMAAADDVVCVGCGRQIAPVQKTEPPVMPAPVVVNYINVYPGRRKNKIAAALLCFFLGVFGIHRFYEGKIATGFLYMFTAGLFGIGWLVDLIIILCKPNPYYV